jgi:membrane protein
LARRGREWVDRQDEGSLRGVAVGAWRCYRAVDGPLQSALLSLYSIIAILPALLVMEEYLDSNPAALANHLARHLDLSSPTASLVRSVLVENRTHELGSALIAIASALFFGVGFGRVLQIVYVRAWELSLPVRALDWTRFAVVLVAVYGFLLALLVQLTELAREPQWVRILVVPGWLALLVLFFVWAPRFLTHKLLARRDLVPGAVLTAVGLLLLFGSARYVMEYWVNLYARDYGGFGVVMAIFFWIGIGSALVVVAASISPALAERRRLRRNDG